MFPRLSGLQNTLLHTLCLRSVVVRTRRCALTLAASARRPGQSKAAIGEVYAAITAGRLKADPKEKGLYN
jgi:hypothetical protein